MKKAIGIIVAILLLAAVGVFAYTQYTYSEGVRAGVLTRFAKKGFVAKTWEGQLNLNLGTVAVQNTYWYFTVKDESTAKKLEGLEGKAVQLHYKQIIHQFWWQGDTNIFVDSVKVINE